MAEIDKAKEEISFRKFWLGISIAVFLSVGGWLLSGDDKSWILVVLACVAELGLIVMIASLNKSIIKQINELKDK